MSAPLNILISGAGVAGPNTAWWIHKALPDAKLTLIEKADGIRKEGHAIDIRGAGVEIIRRMDILDAIRKCHTTEEGVMFVDSAGKSIGEFPATGDSSKQSLTSEFEILRGDLANLLYNHTKAFTTYVFDDSIKTITQSPGSSKVIVDTEKNLLPTKEYDLVLGADGLGSRTRAASFNVSSKDALHSMGQYCCFYTVPKIEGDDRWSRWYSAPGGRLMFLRPDNYGTMRAAFAITNPSPEAEEELQSAWRNGTQAQKDLMMGLLQDVGWQGDRFIKEMAASNEFYFQITAQVRLQNIVKDRVALIGDAGYCPTYLTGFGTTLAFIGGYVLAGELGKNPTDVPAALQAYQSNMKEIIKIGQNTPPGGPSLVCPQTRLGIWILHWAIRIAGSKPAQAAFGVFSGWGGIKEGTKEGWKLPGYAALA